MLAALINHKNSEIMNNEPFETDFSQAWKEYQQSQQFNNCIEILNRKSIYMPYSENILLNAFTAGFTSKYKTPDYEQIFN